MKALKLSVIYLALVLETNGLEAYRLAQPLGGGRLSMIDRSRQ
jgi:hypothetical protein